MTTSVMYPERNICFLPFLLRWNTKEQHTPVAYDVHDNTHDYYFLLASFDIREKWDLDEQIPTRHTSDIKWSTVLVPAEHRSCTCISCSVDSHVAFPALQSLAHSPAVWWSPDYQHPIIFNRIYSVAISLSDSSYFFSAETLILTLFVQIPTSSLNTKFIGELKYVHLFYEFI